MAYPSDTVVLGNVTFYLTIILLFLSWVTVSLRLWVRLRITKSPGWDDATIVLALALFTCYCAFILVITVGAQAEHQFTVQEILQNLMFVQLSEVFYILTTTALKISLGLFFLRLLTKPWQRRLFHTILAVSALYGVFYFFATIFVCGNPAKLADSLLGSRRCAPTGFILATGYLYGIINVVADWIFTLIPILILIDSDMDRSSKISVGLVMGFAAIGSISSILRMVFLKGLLFQANVSPDSIKATIFATAEPGTGIIAASGAILRPLVRQIKTDVHDKISRYGSSKRSRYASTHDPSDAGNRDSIIALTTVESSNPRVSLASKKQSVDLEDPWDDMVSVQQAQMGRMVTIRVAAGESVIGPPVPPKDGWNRPR